MLLVAVNVNSGDAFFVWLQEYLIQSPLKNNGARSTLIRVPKENSLKENLACQLPRIAVGDNDSARLLAFRELIEIFRQSSDYTVFRSLLAILRALEPEQDVWIFEKTLDQLIELGPSVGAWQTQEHAHVLIEVCRAFGDRLSRDQIIRMIQRGESYSRAGLGGLSALYDCWPDAIRGYNLGDYFDDQEVYDLAWYCRFREFHGGITSMEIWHKMKGDFRTDFLTGFGVLEVKDENREYAYRKWPNRTDSAYLDCLTVLSDGD